MKTGPPQLLRATLVKRAGGIRELAEALGLTTQAIYAWGVYVPELRVYQAKVLRPEWFRPSKGEKQS